MTHFTEKQIDLMRLALGLSGIPCRNDAVETILIVHSEMERLGGKFSLRDASQIEYYIRQKYHSVKITAEAKKKVKKV